MLFDAFNWIYTGNIENIRLISANQVKRDISSLVSSPSLTEDPRHKVIVWSNNDRGDTSSGVHRRE